MTDKYVDYAFADGAARITLTAGDRGNPIEPASTQQLHEAVLRAKADGARVIVLAAEGRFFSVGGDLGAFAGADDPAALLLDLAESVHRVVTELVRGDAIVVSVVHGAAAGGGFPLAAAADIVLAADSAKFSLAYAKVGPEPRLRRQPPRPHPRAAPGAAAGPARRRADRAGGRSTPAWSRASYRPPTWPRVADEVVAQLLAGFAGRPRRRQAAGPRRRRAGARGRAPPRGGVDQRARGSPNGQEGIAAFLEKRPRSRFA